MNKLDKEIKDIIKNIQSYENEESCIIILSQEQNKALLNYINILEKDREENNRLHSIIKEVREYIENNEHYDIMYKYDFVYSDKVLEILDKENK